MKRSVADYELQETIETSRDADVYRAVDRARLLRVVLMNVRDRRSDYFAGALAVLGGLNHPNIEKIYEVFSYHGDLWIAVEAIDGDTLEQRMRNALLPISEAIHITQAVAAGLAYMHRAGLAHGDISSSNVLLTNTGGVKLTVVRSILAKTRTIRGSTHNIPKDMRYLAPEQLQGVTVPQSDIWALGTLLYEMTTGRRTFPGDEAAALYSLMHTEPDMSVVPTHFRSVIEKALNKDPERRYQSIRAISSDLAAAANALGIPVIAVSECDTDSAQAAASPELSDKRLFSRWLRGVFSMVSESLSLLIRDGHVVPPRSSFIMRLYTVPLAYFRVVGAVMIVTAFVCLLISLSLSLARNGT